MNRSKKATILLHVTSWLLFYAMVLFFVAGDKQLSFSRFFGPDFLLFYFLFPFLFYFNLYILLPNFLFTKKYVVYISVAVILFVLVYFLEPFDHLISIGRPNLPPPDFNGNGPQFRDRGPGPRPGHIDIMTIILFILTWTVSTAIAIFDRWRLAEKRRWEAESDKANAELSFLKAQINPHFLFNTLNNIYSLVVTKDDKAAEGIMKLSNIMRYITDEVRDDLVPLEREIECMQDYIDLQKMRLSGKTNVDLQINGNPGDKKIAPLLLMTFIENAFKYGTSNHEPTAICIKIDVSEVVIRFFCENKLFDVKRGPERTGIGIQNARKRLAHLYPNKHILNINSDKGSYIVQLTLQA